MQVTGELDDVFGKEVKVETSRGGGTLVMICSKGNLSMVAGAEVGFFVPSMGLSMVVAGSGRGVNLSMKDCSSGVVATSSVPVAGALSGDPLCDVCCDCGR